MDTPARRMRRMLVGGIIALTGCTLEQVQIGQWYSIYTPPTGSCPRLGWHYVVDPHRSIAGYLTDESQTRIATLAGTLNPDDSFRMSAAAANGGSKADIDGRFTAQLVTIAIGRNSFICAGQTFRLRTVRGQSLSGGGGGG